MSALAPHARTADDETPPRVAPRFLTQTRRVANGERPRTDRLTTTRPRQLGEMRAIQTWRLTPVKGTR